MGRLQGKVVVVTGAARGIGRAIADAVVGEGAALVAADRAWDGVPGWTADSDRVQQDQVLQVTFDVTDQGGIAAAKHEIVGHFGTVDVLVNNVGLRQKDLYPPSGAVTVLDSKNADWEAMFGVNVLGTLNVTRALAPLMVAQRGGSIVNIGSRDNPKFRNQPYAASKAALTSLSIYLAEELRGANVAVNVLFPTGTMTTGSEEMVSSNRAQGIAVAPLLRPGHVVPLALHLAEQDAGGVTGQALAAVEWNREHGFGEPAEWLAEPV